jgi:hypothetical protein
MCWPAVMNITQPSFTNAPLHVFLHPQFCELILILCPSFFLLQMFGEHSDLIVFFGSSTVV